MLFCSQKASDVSEINSFGWNLIRHCAHSVSPDIITAPYLTVAATDGRFYHKVTKNIYRFITVPLTSEDISRIHGVDERIRIEDLGTLVQFYDLVIRLAQTETFS